MSDPSINKQNIYIDPQIEPILERMLTDMAERGPVGSVPPPQMRERFNEDVSGWNLDLPDMHNIEDFQIETEAGLVPVRLYDPVSRNTQLPCLVFIHGGGWIVGDLETNERTMRLLAIRSGIRVLSVDYPLAPENKFPAGLDACVAVTRWVYRNGRDWGINPDRLGVGGDSAGGNLALATALELRNAGENWLKLGLMIYPALSPHADTESHQSFGQGEFGLGTDAMHYFWSEYLADASQRNDPRAVPLLADMHSMPPMYIVTAGLDALTDDSRALEQKLKESGIEVNHRHYPGMIHGFFSMALFLDVAEKAVTEAAAALVDTLHNPTAANLEQE